MNDAAVCVRLTQHYHTGVDLSVATSQRHRNKQHSDFTDKETPPLLKQPNISLYLDLLALSDVKGFFNVDILMFFIESVQTFSFTCRFGMLSLKNRNSRVRLCSNIAGINLNDISQIHKITTRKKVQSVRCFLCFFVFEQFMCCLKCWFSKWGSGTPGGH